MPNGVEQPMRINARGGIAQTLNGTAGIIGASLSPNRDSNPWTKVVGIGTEDYAFAVLDPLLESEIRERAELVMGRMRGQGRASLEAIGFLRADDSGKLRVVIRYLDLATRETRVIEQEV